MPANRHRTIRTRDLIRNTTRRRPMRTRRACRRLHDWRWRNRNYNSNALFSGTRCGSTWRSIRRWSNQRRLRSWRSGRRIARTCRPTSTFTTIRTGQISTTSFHPVPRPANLRRRRRRRRQWGQTICRTTIRNDTNRRRRRITRRSIQRTRMNRVAIITSRNHASIKRTTPRTRRSSYIERSANGRTITTIDTTSATLFTR